MRNPVAFLPLLLVPTLAALLLVAVRPGAESGAAVRERAMALVNAGQQISAAQAIYSIRSGSPAGEISALVDKGVLQIPDQGSHDDAARIGSWKTDGRYASVALDGDVGPLCAEIARQASSSRSGVSGGVGVGGDQFGCVLSDSVPRFMFRIW